MAVSFVIGPSGAGKTYKICKEMVEKSVSDLSNSLMAIVPEQFTMQTQTDIVMMHPNHGTMNIDILSFERLAYRIFEELGWKNPELLDDTGKNLILRRVIDKNADALSIYKDRSKSTGFVEEVKSGISALYQYNIDEKKFEEMLGLTKDKPVLRRKIEDINYIYKKFNEEIEEKYTTKEALLSVLARLVKNSSIIKNSDIYIDGFTGFTPVQYTLLAELIKYAKNVVFTVCIDYEECKNLANPKEFELFALSKQTINKIREIAKKNDVEILPFEMAESNEEKREKPYRLKDSVGLSHLEKNIFRYKKADKLKENNDIRVISCADAHAEAEKVAVEINKLVKTEGYRYRDVAVITADSESYNSILRDEFEINGIPGFIDLKRRLKTNPMPATLLAALKVVESNFSYESVFVYLKAGLVELSESELFALENYVRAKGIKGFKRWSTEWIKSSSEGDDIQLINETRVKVITPLVALRDALKGRAKSVEIMTSALYQLTEMLDMQSKLENFAAKCEEEGKSDLASEYEQVYKLIMEFFDKLVDLNGDEKMSVSEYIRLVESGFDELKCGVIPPAVDSVVVGDLQRTRLKDIKTLFFVGVNDTVVPAISDASGLLTQNDKKFLEKNGIELSPTNIKQNYIQRFYLYLAMTKPSKKLVITYRRLADDGSEMQPSSIIKNVKSLFEEFDEENYCEFNFKDISSKILLKRYIVNATRKYAKGESLSGFVGLADYIKKDKELSEFLIKSFNAAFAERINESLNGEIAKMLFGERIKGGVSRFEQYAACAFSHFINYGLKLKERKQFKVELSDFGTIVHESLQKISVKIEKSDMRWGELEKEKIEEMVNESVEEVVGDKEQFNYLDTARDRYMINRAKRILHRTMTMLDYQAAKGKFKPKKFEFEFTKNLGDVNLVGKIDRVDYCEENDNILVKVIDYKTGKKDFKIIDAYYGIQLQLVTYMGEAMELAEKEAGDRIVIPAGLYYFEAKDPYVYPSEDKIAVFQMKGLTNDDKDVYTAIDDELVNAPAKYKSKIVSFKLDKDGLPSEDDSLDSDQFADLINYVREKINLYGQEIKSGKIAVNPYIKDAGTSNETTSCKYCKLAGICGFDDEDESCKYRMFVSEKNADVMSEIEKEKY